MALSEHMRSVAHQMFSEGKDSKAVARRIRQPINSVAAMKANWTRNQGSAPTTTQSTTSTTSDDLVTVKLRSTRLQNAIRDGKSVQLVIEV